MRRLTTLATVLVLLGGVVGCGSSKPASPLSTAATTPVAQSPLTRCVHAWNNGAADTGTKADARIEVGGASEDTHVATVAIYNGYKTVSLPYGSVHPGACIVIDGLVVWVQEPNGLWATQRIGYESLYLERREPFPFIRKEAKTWTLEHANVSVAPEILPSEPESENNGKLTAMEGKSPFQMTAEEVGGERNATTAEATETTPTTSTESSETTPPKHEAVGRSCGSISGELGSIKGTGTGTSFSAEVYVHGSSPSCSFARAMLYAVFTGRSEHHEGENAASSYSIYQGWHCTYRMHSAGCWQTPGGVPPVQATFSES